MNRKNLVSSSTLSNTGLLRIDVRPSWFLSPGDSGKAILYVDLYNQSSGDITIDNVSIDSCRDASDSLQFRVGHFEIIDYNTKDGTAGYAPRPSYARYEEIPNNLRVIKPKQYDTDFRRLLFEIQGPTYDVVRVGGLKSCCVAVTIQIRTGGDTQTLHSTYWMKRETHRYPWFLRDG